MTRTVVSTPVPTSTPGRWAGLTPEHRDQLLHLLVDALGLAAAGAANDDARRVLDGRNALDREAWESAGWTYRALGRRNV